MESNVNFKYYAFISYSHEDEEVAKHIQKKLTEYKLPSVIRKANPLLPENVRPIFRDATNLTTGMLQGTLNSELEHSKFLIVLCSPNSAKPNDENKHWVNKEVQHFIDLERAEFIIPVIVGGEPHATNPEEECFCPALLSLPGGDELLGIDIRKDPKKKLSPGKTIKRKLGIPDEDDLEEKGIVHIVAKMLGLDIDDLWDWNKKAQKRKAYAKLFTAAAVFVIILSVGLSVYFKKFHVYHEYYVDYVERAVQKKNGTDIEFIGLGKLTQKQIKKRERHFRFDYRDGKLRMIIYENSVKIPKPVNIIEYKDRAMIQELEYNETTGYLQAIISKNECNSILLRYDYERQGTVVDLKDKNGLPAGILSKSTSSSTMQNNVWEDMANIKSYLLERDENGYVIKKMYFKTNGAEYPAKDADGISGFEYKLDDFGRPIQIWYLGVANNKFIRQASKNGIAGCFLEYDSHNNIIKNISVNSNGQPIYNDSYCSGVEICIVSYDTNGNAIKQSYIDKEGKLYPNSEGLAYYTSDYDNYGNRIRMSLYDKENHAIISKDYYSIVEYDYDKNGNIIECRFYDSNKELCMTKDGYAISRSKYNHNNQLIEITYYDTNRLPVLVKGEYAKTILTYNTQGDIESFYFYDEEGKPCYDSNGRSKITHVYNENHKIIESNYYDVDFESLINCNDNFARIVYKYDKLSNCIESKYFDKNNNPVNDKNGYCYVKYSYDDSGNIFEIAYYDKNNELSINDKGYAGIILSYDENGNKKTKSFYGNAEKQLCNTKDGYAYVEFEFDEKGNLKYEILYDANKNLLSPFCKITSEYDNNNNITSIRYYGKNNQLVCCNDNYAEVRFEYNQLGLETKESFFDVNGNYSLNNNECAICSYKYDEYGRKIEISYYGIDGKLYNGLHPYTIIKKKYDIMGNEIEKLYYQDENQLINSTKSDYAIVRKHYDKYRNRIKTEFFDEHGKLFNCEYGFAVEENYYDNRKKLTNQKLYNKDLELWAELLYEDGIKTYQVIYQNEGKIENFYENGQKKHSITTTEEYTSEFFYENNKLIKSIYNYNTQNQSVTDYKDDVIVHSINTSKDGTITENFYEDEKIVHSIDTYNDGSTSEFFFSNNKSTYSLYINADGTKDETFYENGKPKKTIYYSKNGEKKEYFYK